MPAPPASALVMFILCTQFKPTLPLGWETPTVLNQIGIKAPPSLTPTAPIPPGLSRVSSAAIFRFIDSAKGYPLTTRMGFIQGGSGFTIEEGRDLWKKWYASTISPYLNGVVDGLWKEHGVWPFDVMMQQDMVEFPSTDSLTGNMEFGIGIFGKCVGNGAYTINSAQPYVKSFLVHNVTRLRKAWKRVKDSADKMCEKSRKGKLWTGLECLMEKVVKEEVRRVSEGNILKFPYTND